MRLIHEIGYSVKVGQEEAHQRWLTDNDAALRAASPAGTSYIGRLLRDWSQFWDTDPAAPWSNTILKDVIDATIWDPKAT